MAQWHFSVNKTVIPFQPVKTKKVEYHQRSSIYSRKCPFDPRSHLQLNRLHQTFRKVPQVLRKIQVINAEETLIECTNISIGIL